MRSSVRARLAPPNPELPVVDVLRWRLLFCLLPASSHSFFFVGVPTWISPPAVLPDKDFGHSTGARGPFSLNLGFQEIAAPNDSYIAEVLHLGAGELEPKQSSTFGMKFS